MIRILLVPFLVALILVSTPPAAYAAAGVFMAGALTDRLDGYLARRFGPSTRTGQWLDPLADKLLVGAAVVTLAALGRFPAWAAIVIVVRELAISALRVVLGLRGVAMPASSAGKVKTILQLVAITLYLLPLDEGLATTRIWLLVAAIVVTIASAGEYVVRAAGPLRRARDHAATRSDAP